MPIQVSISVLVIPVAVSVVAFFMLGLLCGKHLKKTKSTKSIHPPVENIPISMKFPVYEEVKLENDTAAIDLTQNIAYEQVKKTVS